MYVYCVQCIHPLLHCSQLNLFPVTGLCSKPSQETWQCRPFSPVHRKWGRYGVGSRERWRERWRERGRGREGGKEGGREGGREVGREGGREGGTEGGGSERGRVGGREGMRAKPSNQLVYNNRFVLSPREVYQCVSFCHPGRCINVYHSVTQGGVSMCIILSPRVVFHSTCVTDMASLRTARSLLSRGTILVCRFILIIYIIIMMSLSLQVFETNIVSNTNWFLLKRKPTINKQVFVHAKL